MATVYQSRRPGHPAWCPPRHGFALLIALLALALSTALLLAVTLRVDEDARVARGETLREHATGAAEQALWNAMTSTDPRSLRDEPVGTVTTSTSTMEGVTTTVTVTKVDTPLVWIVAGVTVRRGREMARRRVGVTAIVPRDTLYSPLRPIPGRAWVDLF